MPFDDLRSYLHAIEERGGLQRIYKEVDWDLEISAVLRRAGDKAVWCERVRGSELPLVTNLYMTREHVALALDTTPGRMLWEYIERGAKPVAPRIVGDAPVQEIVLTGDDVDLGRLP